MTHVPISSPPVLVLITWPADRPVDAFARTLVEERLAACVNVLADVQSLYRWEGAVQQDAERQLLVKTTADRLDALEARVAALHPYEVPEFLVVPIGGGSDRYLEWLRTQTRP
ncbi:MAG: divalent-cation tolerance protein CutA [Vicinamibacterales bacterium]|jgi:periplasmic divalent cation tolerance protein|nr:divalent-cation tolerance protein CutA [Vicinamibacterales bacterium]